MEEAKLKTVFIKPDASLQRDQIRTINVIRGRSKCESMDAEPQLIETLSKVCKMDPHVILSVIQDYLSNTAPLVIHVSDKTLALLLSDTHYRSSFETATHNNANAGVYMDSRIKWESECFLKLYDGVTNFERPKYGALNFLNKSTGVKAAAGYGRHYVTLKRHVRQRVTLSTCDTSSSRCLGVLDYCDHVLNHLSEFELKELTEVATGKKLEGNEKQSQVYREIQIHGELDIARDFEALHVTKESDIAVEFSKKFNVPIIFS